MIRPGVLSIAAIVIASAASCGDRPERPPADGRTADASTTAEHPWAVSATGSGRIRAGMTLGEAAAASPVQLSAKRDWAECTYVEPSPAPDGLMFMIFDGRIARVDVTTDDVPTTEGIRVGDSEERVYEAYGSGNVVRSPHKYTDGSYLTVAPDPGHRLVFETDGSRVTRFRGGRLPEVEWVEGCS